MSFLKKLFGLSGAPAKTNPESPPEEYKGFFIRATPYEENGAFQLCGVISKQIDSEMKEHTFVRADRLPSREAAESLTLSKARQIIDLEGDRIFLRG